MNDDRLKGRLAPHTPHAQLGALGEYRVDRGMWRAVTGPVCALEQGEHVVTVRLYGWCEYRAVIRGADGAFDALAVPLHYKEPKEVLPPTWTAGHRVAVDMGILHVAWIRPVERTHGN